ncbi:MAG: response regulator [Pleurocapsa sp.]
MLPKKLLLIDDNEDNRTLVKMTLEITTNWTIVTASGGLEGISEAKAQIPDVILLDLLMPELDGLNVYNILKNNEITCDIPIIFMTAAVNNKILTELGNTNAQGILTKPLNTVTLASDVANFCGWHFFSEGKKNRLKILSGKRKSNTCQLRRIYSNPI